jgi:hypothetical protein
MCKFFVGRMTSIWAGFVPINSYMWIADHSLFTLNITVTLDTVPLYNKSRHPAGNIKGYR